ncbi:ECF RNA polymerase sigma factor SigE [Aquisphaera giovannonii]|uniref:ECF RNA polymerase sigma factor SigE n=1 Tax=Aquisphaera giovannonii TaxID=406548 RepID=A0A5B9WEB1_9BACT|nr:RNA polymerase sigma factor [Aquisphaera giovannonii]QEH38877.1 ECF RNA polymerase sigma factor SigE [Aquisphaera giovannonii]
METLEPVPTTGAGGSGEPDWPAALSAHDRWLRRVVAARVREEQAVDEVMQEVALAAIAQRAPLLDSSRQAGWLYRLAIRQALLYRRRAGRRRALVGRYAGREPRGEEDPNPSPLAWLLRDERRDLVRIALERLHPRDADLLMLKYAEGWSARDLADRLGVGLAAVEARLHRARGKLRAELATLAVGIEDVHAREA